MTQYDKNCENFLTYMKAVKNVAQDVIHAYDTADEDGNVAWEIIEDIMQGLIAVYLDTFKWDDGKSEDYAVSISGLKIPLHKNLTESDMERDIDSLEERVDEIDDRLDALIKQVSELTIAVGRLEGQTGNVIRVSDTESDMLADWQSATEDNIKRLEERLKAIEEKIEGYVFE